MTDPQTLNEPVNQAGDVFAALPQRRYLDQKGAESDEPFVARSFIVEANVGGTIQSAYDAHIHWDGFFLANTKDSAILKGSRYLLLDNGRQRVHLVEKERARRSLLKCAPEN
ncbi:MAG TPA: hypothetical protein VMM57_09415 [Bacteroidota bacterium]|nr:hypothetical protein [Bacteroidota bacterium]